MSIINNMPAVRAWRMQNENAKKISKSSEKLASALDITSAADDAAGLAISEKMKAQVRGMNRANDNIGEAMNLLDVADGAMSQYQAMIHRIRELCVQASSDTNDTAVDRHAIQKEIAQITNEINELTKTARYNHINLFDGSVSGKYGYAYGLRQLVTEPMPAQVAALEAFSQVKITGGENAVRTIPANSNYLGEMSAVGEHLPLEGYFTIRVDDPDAGTVRAVLDFAAWNPDGTKTLADFEKFYQDELGHVADVSIDANGVIKVEGNGLGGAKSRVYIGIQEGAPSGAKYVNSAIFGGYNYTSNYSTSGLRSSPATVDVDMGEETEEPYANWRDSETLWSSILANNGGTVSFTYSISRYSTSGTYYPYDVYPAVSHSQTINVKDCKTINEAVKMVAGTISTNSDVYTGFSVSPTRYRDRDGNIWVNFSMSAGLKPPYNSGYPYSSSGGYGASSFYNAASTPSTLTTNYALTSSDRIGKFTVTVNGIPGIPSKTSKTVTLDFSDPPMKGASDQDILDYLNLHMNANPPSPDVGVRWVPGITAAGYDSTKHKVAYAYMDSSGRLCVTPVEYDMSIRFDEAQSDRPMLTGTYYSDSGVDWGSALVIADDFGKAERITIAPGTYRTLDEFIKKNQKSAEAAGFMLENSGNRLVVSTLGKGPQYTIADAGKDPPAIRFDSMVNTAAANAYEAEINTLLGIDTFTSKNGYYEAQNVDNSLWIQTGANKGDGLYIGIPCLDAYDLGLMIYESDRINPAAYMGISSMGVDAYTTTLNVDAYNPNPFRSMEELEISAAKTGYYGYLDLETENDKLKKPGYSLDVSTHEKASEGIHIANNALNIVSTERAVLGAQRNRLEHTSQNLSISSENLQAAQSRITDVDMAKEVTRRLSYNILTEASTAMLVQANASPQNVLQLLR